MRTDEAVESDYPVVAHEIARRILFCESALLKLIDDPQNPNAWIEGDLVTLQVRKICEMLMLGSVLAHQREGEANFNDRKWRPKDAFSKLTEFSEHPLQLPIDLEFYIHPSGTKQIRPLSKAIPFSVLSTIYGQCGDLLHVPTASRVKKGKVPVFDIPKFQGWIIGLKRLMAGHVLILPDRQKILMCLWQGTSARWPEIHLLEADGPSCLDLDALPNFSILIP